MDSSFDLRKTRNNLVAKDNKMIQNSRYALTGLENKAVLYLISKIQPNDEPNKHYLFNCKEFQALVKWNGNASYQNVKAMLSKLATAQWWIDDDTGENEYLVRWFNIVHMNKGTGDIEISFHEDMFPFLLNLQERVGQEGQYYTTYKLQNVSLMRCRYSPRLYEILKSYQFNNKKWTFENGTGSKYDLQVRLADKASPAPNEPPIIPENWSNFAIFRRDVLDKAVKEINKYTDIKVTYEAKQYDIHHRKTRAYRTIEFYMAGKTDPEQQETDNIIDAEYREIEDEANYHQMTIEEAFFQEHEKKMEEARLIKEAEEAERHEQAINESAYPLMSSMLGPDFTEEQVTYLHSIAIKDRVAGKVKFSDWELFAVDLVTEYFENIKYLKEHVDNINADASNTKTTVYKRLVDCVRNDYMKLVPQLLSKYAV